MVCLALEADLQANWQDFLIAVELEQNKHSILGSPEISKNFVYQLLIFYEPLALHNFAKVSDLTQTWARNLKKILVRPWKILQPKLARQDTFFDGSLVEYIK